MTFLLRDHRRDKEATGQDFPLICRLSGSDFVEGSHTLDETVIVAAGMEEAGVDLISVTGGWHETRVPQITMNVPRGAYVYLAEGIHECGQAYPGGGLQQDKRPRPRRSSCLRRAAPTSWRWHAHSSPTRCILRKASEGRPDDIRTCIACNQGCFDHVFMLKPSPAC